MQSIETLPDMEIFEGGAISARLLKLGISTFLGACRHVHRMPYGYNSDRDDLFILFKEGRGTCTSKHAVIASLARELKLDVVKQIGIYAMNEALVTGTREILARHHMPYLPMVHCFLASGTNRVDLTEGNRNGKNGPIDEFLAVETVEPHISGKEEYLLYRQALTHHILQRPEWQGFTITTILKARQEGLELLKANVNELPRQQVGNRKF